MILRITFRWLGGLAVMAASAACLIAQEGVKSAQSLPPGEPVSENLKPATTNLPATGANENVVGRHGPPGTYVSSWLLDIVKLSQAGINRDVMLTFIDSAGTFNLDADQIVYLHELKVPAEVITAMMQHDAELISGLRAPDGAVSGSQPGFNLKFAQTDAPKSGATAAGSPPALTVPVEARPVARSAEAQRSLPVWREFEQQRQAPETPAVVSPVRLPYAVQLLDPIIMIPGEGRAPNLLVIELFP